MDFESPHSAEIAVKALQAQGVQAQMAKVNLNVSSLIHTFYLGVVVPELPYINFELLKYAN